MKTLLVLLFMLFFFASAKSCKEYPLQGDTVAIIYPSSNVARIRTVLNSCPLKVTSATQATIEDLPDAGCWIPPEQCEKYTRDFEDRSCK